MTNTLSLPVGTAPRRRGARGGDLLPALFAATLAAALPGVALALHWQGADWPAQVFRIETFRRAGFVVWNLQWYDGHHVLGYSVLSPAAGALLGPGGLDVLCADVVAYCFTTRVQSV